VVIASGQTITFAQSVALDAERDIDRAFEHPHLLVRAQVARAGVERDAPAWWEMHFDDLKKTTS
jgi:hypothetical protein